VKQEKRKLKEKKCQFVHTSKQTQTCTVKLKDCLKENMLQTRQTGSSSKAPWHYGPYKHSTTRTTRTIRNKHQTWLVLNKYNFFFIYKNDCSNEQWGGVIGFVQLQTPHLRNFWRRKIKIKYIYSLYTGNMKYELMIRMYF